MRNGALHQQLGARDFGGHQWGLLSCEPAPCLKGRPLNKMSGGDRTLAVMLSAIRHLSRLRAGRARPCKCAGLTSGRGGA